MAAAHVAASSCLSPAPIELKCQRSTDHGQAQGNGRIREMLHNGHGLPSIVPEAMVD